MTAEALPGVPVALAAEFRAAVTAGPRSLMMAGSWCFRGSRPGWRRGPAWPGGPGRGQRAGGHAAAAGVRGAQAGVPGAERYGLAAERAAGRGQRRGDGDRLVRAGAGARGQHGGGAGDGLGERAGGGGVAGVAGVGRGDRVAAGWQGRGGAGGLVGAAGEVGQGHGGAQRLGAAAERDGAAVGRDGRRGEGDVLAEGASGSVTRSPWGACQIFCVSWGSRCPFVMLVGSFSVPGQTGTRSPNATANAFMAAFQP